MSAAEPSVSEARLDRDRELARLGWARRFTASPPRLVELRQLYEKLGHEVFLDRLTAGELAPQCAGCALALTMFRVIYTRPGALPGASTDPLARGQPDGRKR